METDYLLNIIAFFIFINAASIIGYFIKDGENNYSGSFAFPFALIALVISLFIFLPKEYPLDKYSQTHIYSINHSSLSISDGFFIGSGIIETNQVYVGEVKKSGSYVQYLIPAKDTIKIERDIDHAIFKEQLCERKSLFMEKILESKLKAVKCAELNPKRILEIPNGTIIKQFKL